MRANLGCWIRSGQWEIEGEGREKIATGTVTSAATNMAGDGDFSPEKHDEGPRDLGSIREKHREIEREMANSSVVPVKAGDKRIWR